MYKIHWTKNLDEGGLDSSKLELFYSSIILISGFISEPTPQGELPNDN